MLKQLNFKRDLDSERVEKLVSDLIKVGLNLDLVPVAYKYCNKCGQLLINMSLQSTP